MLINDTGEPEEADREKWTSNIFEPKDEHCGIWQDAPNPRCHASFGDRGTTASVSCFGNLIQMSQFLGAGHSEVFTMDHGYTPEPYFVCGRAEHLEFLAKGQAELDDTSTFGLLLPEEYSPQQPPEVKWVNWRWPRYGWDTKTTGVTAHCQWVVHDGTVLQQFVLKNSNEAPIHDFWFEARKNMLIRDLDYLDDSYSFNDHYGVVGEAYHRFSGPGGLASVTTLKLDKPSPKGEPSGNNNIHRSYSMTSQERLVPGRVDQAPHTNQKSPAEQNSDSTSPRGVSNEDSTNRLYPGDSQAFESSTEPGQRQPIQSGVSRPGSSLYSPDRQSGVFQQEIDVPKLHRHAFNTGAEAGDRIPAENPMSRPDHIENTWSADKPHSVASVMALYCNGKAKNIQPTSSDVWTEEIPGKSPKSEFGVLEIVVAYKLAVLPNRGVHWRNFLVAAEEADVNNILREETVRLWGEDKNKGGSLCELGLSMIDPDETTGTRNAPNQENSESEDAATSDAPNTRTRRESAPDLKDSQNGPVLGQTSNSKADPNPRPVCASPKGLPSKSSPKNQIEYMAWRHLEHILSVCAIPLLPCTLFNDAEGSKPHGSAVNGEIIALTCGDMSGHRICTSASLYVPYARHPNIGTATNF